MPEQSDSILRFQDVAYHAESARVSALATTSFELGRSELMLVRQDAHVEPSPLFDLAEGMRVPSSGEVYFRGARWGDVPLVEQARARATIGRVFEGQGWISNLDVFENIALAQLHHTTRSEAEIRREAEELASEAGLSAIPAGRPHVFGRRELRAAQWVRAMLGERVLLLLDRPLLDAAKDEVGRLCGMVERERERGCAVIWLTSDARIWSGTDFENRKRYELQGDALVPVEGAD